MPRRRKYPVWLIQSRTIYDHIPGTGKRYPGGKVVLGKWVNWTEYVDNTLNFSEAVRFARKKLMRQRIGTIVYIRRLSERRHPTHHVVKLFQAKWGHDDKPFAQFDGVAGAWWARQAGLLGRVRSQV